MDNIQARPILCPQWWFIWWIGSCKCLSTSHSIASVYLWIISFNLLKIIDKSSLFRLGTAKQISKLKKTTRCYSVIFLEKYYNVCSKFNYISYTLNLLTHSLVNIYYKHDFRWHDIVCLVYDHCSKRMKLTTGSGASSCLHIIQGTPVWSPTAIFAAQRT